jgi:hypothetical protein
MYIMEQERPLAADRLYPLGLLSLWASARTRPVTGGFMAGQPTRRFRHQARTLKLGFVVAGQARPAWARPSDKPIASDTI